jgi:hypothetical protein
MENEEQGENLETNQEPVEQGDVDIEEIRKENETLKAQKAHWKKKYEEASTRSEETKEQPQEKSETLGNEESSEPSYNLRLDRLTLRSEGITNSDDQDMVIKEAKRLSLPIEDIIKEDYIKSRLKNLSSQREAEAGMPDGSGKTTSGARSSVDYWLNKKDGDGFALPADPKLKIEVINARMEQERRKREFPD